MQYITVTSFRVIFNGKAHYPFNHERGICQGNPLFLYIFIISVEYLGPIHPFCFKLEKI